MVDIHSHLVWGVDDGPGSMRESIEMAILAADRGTQIIVATPHSNYEYSYDRDLIQGRILALQDAVEGRIQILRGCDMHLSYENVSELLKDSRKYTINSKNHVLVEFSDVSILPSAQNVFEQMLAEGLTPIITHPERNALLRERLVELNEWVEQGCAIQVTAQSLLGRFGRDARRFAHLLVKRGLAQVVASDGHDIEWRPPALDSAYRYVAECFGETKARRLFIDNPTHVVSGKELTVEEASPRRGDWHRFWRI